jgi:hypothetical protein
MKKIPFKLTLAVMLFGSLINLPCAAQDSLNYGNVDLMTLISSKEKRQSRENAQPQKGKMIIFVVPAIGSNPSLGTFFGVAATGAMYLGNPETTNISSLSNSILITTKNQLLFNLKGTIMSTDNKWEFLLDTRYLIFSEATYGLGSDNLQPVKSGWNFGGIETSGIDGAQPMSFDHFRMHFTSMREIKENMYAGIGYHLDYHYHISDQMLDTISDPAVITSHYAYSDYYGFPTNRYTTSGLSFNIAIDSRDHTVSPYVGEFLQLAYRFNTTWLGSADNSQTLYLEARKYLPIPGRIRNPKHLIGIWGIAYATVQGNLPYLDLPASSYDMRGRIGRGYVAGRFRGPDWVTVEAEYRFPITRNGLIGGVVFGSATTTSRQGYTYAGTTFERLKLFEAIRPACGFGGRVQLDKSGRLNVAVDMAWGQDGSKGFYFNIGETF